MGGWGGDLQFLVKLKGLQSLSVLKNPAHVERTKTSANPELLSHSRTHRVFPCGPHRRPAHANQTGSRGKKNCARIFDTPVLWSGSYVDFWSCHELTLLLNPNTRLKFQHAAVKANVF